MPDVFAWIVLTAVAARAAVVVVLRVKPPGLIARKRGHRWGQIVTVAGWIPLLGFGAALAQAPAPSAPIWTVPEIGALPDDAQGRLVRRGRDLITATYAHIGPRVGDPAKRYAGNNLACS